jgi:hypothetical protein
MTMRRINFEELPWESPAPGIRHKVAVRGGRRLRLVEYSMEMPPHWCERGHLGLILDGRFEIRFDDETVVFAKGDGVFIPSGAGDRHNARVLTETVTALFVEENE